MGDWIDSCQDLDGETPQRNVRLAVGGFKETLERELASLKMQAQTAQQQRVLMSVGLWTVMVPAEIVEPALKVAKTFAMKHKGASQHKFGSPHVQVWRQILMTIISEASEKKTTLEDQQKIEQAIALLGNDLK